MTASQSTPLHPMINLYEYSLKYQNRSQNTIRIYAGTVIKFAEYVTTHGGVTDWSQVSKTHIERFIVDVRERGGSAGYASNLYRSLQQFFKWWAEETESRNPMDRTKAPHLPDKPVNVLRDDQLLALLKATEGTTFVQRRDRAILLLLLDTGLRRAELTGIKVTDVDLAAGEIRVSEENAKNRVARTVSYGGDAALAIGRYLTIARAAHPQHGREALWLGERGKGPLTPNGVYQMIRKRGKVIGVDPLYPHMLRHTWVHEMKKAGVQPDEIMAAAGWKDQQMLARYAASTAGQRARETMRRVSPADRLRKGK